MVQCHPHGHQLPRLRGERSKLEKDYVGKTQRGEITMTNQKTTSVTVGFGFILSIIIGVIGALIRHSLWAGFAFFLLAFLVDFVALIGFVPVAGPFLYWYFFGELQNALFKYAMVRPGFLAEIIFIFGLIFSIIYTVIGTLVALYI